MPSRQLRVVKSQAGAAETVDAVAAGLTAAGKDTAAVRQVLLEAAWVVVDEIVTPEQVVPVLSKVDADVASIVRQVLPDVLWFIGLEVRSKESDEEKELSAGWRQLCHLVQLCVNENVVDRQAVLERLELDLIAGAGLGDVQAMQKQLVRTNTNALYRQRKFNLLSEETEGFAKLITELESLNTGNINETIENMQKLIGFFRLDPNRVYDVVLEAHENDPDNLAFLQVLRQFRTSNLKQILGFKFQMYHPERDSSIATSDEKEDEKGDEKTESVPESWTPTPISLFYLTAKLIERQALVLEDVLPHLHPSSTALTRQAVEREQHVLRASRKVGVVRLNARTAEETKREKQEELAKALELKRKIEYEDATNQRVGLVAGLLGAGNWEAAHKLANELGAGVTFDHPHVLGVLYEQLDHVLEPLVKNLPQYAMVNPSSSPAHGTERTLLNPDVLGQGAFAQATSLADFCKRFTTILVAVGHRLSRNLPLYTKLLRVIAADAPMWSATELSSDGKAVKKSVFRMLDQVFLPALCLAPTPNPPLALLLWTVLDRFSLAIRFDLYERMRTEHYERIPELQMARAQNQYSAKQVLKRVASGKDVMRMVCRRLGKVSHNNPIASMSSLLDSIQSYDNLIPIMVDSMKQFSALTFDVLAYLLVAYLGKSESSKIKEDGQSHSNWLQALCKFAGYLYTKYPQVELEGLMHYLVRQLKLNRSLDLLVLEEIVARMTGIEVLEDCSEDVLVAMAGGDVLRVQARAVLVSNASPPKKKAIKKIRSTLEDGQLLAPLLVLIAQQTNAILFDPENKNLKLIGHKYDTCVAVLCQFVEFLTLQIPVNELGTKHMLTLAEMMFQYHIDPVIAFHISRPVISAALHKASFPAEPATSRWFLEDATAAKWIPDAPDMIQVAKQAIASRAEESPLSPELYSLFWCLSIYDIMVPRIQYDKEIARVQAERKRISAQPMEGKAAEKKKRNMEVSRLDATEASLKKELSDQTQNRTVVVKFFEQHKDTWLPSGVQALTALSDFMQLCVLPRMLFSGTDALFCARFLKLMHDKSVHGFSTIYVIDMTVQYVVANLFCATEGEAINLGIFLKEILAMLAEWAKAKTFAKEFQSRPGAVSKFGEPDSPKITFEEFTKCVDSWHSRLGVIFASGLKSNSYMQIRPTLLVTSKIIDLFPFNNSISKNLMVCAGALAKTDSRQDIKTMAKRYESLLGKKLKSQEPKASTSSGPNEMARDRFKDTPGETLSRQGQGQHQGKVSSRTVSSSTNKSSGGAAATQKSSNSNAANKPREPVSKRRREDNSSGQDAAQAKFRKVENKPTPNRDDKPGAQAPKVVPTAQQQQQHQQAPRPRGPQDSSTGGEKNHNSRVSRDKASFRDGYSRDGRDGRDTSDNRDSRDSRGRNGRGNMRDAGEPLDRQDGRRDPRGPREPRDPRGSNTNSGARERDVPRGGNNAGGSGGARERNSRDTRDIRDSRDARDHRDGRDGRDSRDNRDPRGSRDHRDTRDMWDSRDKLDPRDSRGPRDSRDLGRRPPPRHGSGVSANAEHKGKSSVPGSSSSTGNGTNRSVTSGAGPESESTTAAFKNNEPRPAENTRGGRDSGGPPPRRGGGRRGRGGGGGGPRRKRGGGNR